MYLRRRVDSHDYKMYVSLSYLCRYIAFEVFFFNFWLYLKFCKMIVRKIRLFGYYVSRYILVMWQS